MLKDLTADNIYIVCGHPDMRKSIDGLAALVQQQFQLDLFTTNSAFLFCGRRRDRMKVLLWEDDGFLLLYKRLEDGKFSWPRNEQEVRNITREQFIWLTQGLSIDQPKAIKKIAGGVDIEQKIISLYAKGMTTRQISETIEDIYGFEVSDGMVSDITDRLLPQIEDWQKRPLDEVYPIVFIDAVHFSVRDNGQIRKLAAYVILSVSMTGHKEVLSIHIGENESAKYWLGVLNELKNRGVKDILVICADGLTGMKEAVSAAFPQTELQRCIVHQVRNTLKYVGEKNKKEYANDLKTIYHAPSEDAALEALDRVTEKWEDDYPNAMKSWYKNWDVISPIFKFSSDVRKVIYTTNAIESLNSGYRRLNKQRSVFPSDTALLKALYLATHEIAKKWTVPLRNWGKVLGELEIMYSDRLG